MWEILAALGFAATAAPSSNAINKGFLLRQAGEPSLSVHHAAGPGPSILYVHGSTFPAALSMFYRMDGKSWADDLHARGFDVWAFDFPGYGGSDRPASMHLPSLPREGLPSRAPDATHQIERVVRYIRENQHQAKVSIIAHSWGTIPAGLFAGTHSDWLDRLVLFGGVAQRDGHEPLPAKMAPFSLVTAKRQWTGFQSGVPKDHPSPISKRNFDPWAAAYLASDSTSNQREPRSVKVPTGPDADFDDAWNGHLPYDPSLIRTPTLLVRGEWDPITEDADAAWLVKAMLNVPSGARDVKLPRGGHRMHLEDNRQTLFDAVGEFLGEARR